MERMWEKRNSGGDVGGVGRGERGRINGGYKDGVRI